MIHSTAVRGNLMSTRRNPIFPVGAMVSSSLSRLWRNSRPKAEKVRRDSRHNRFFHLRSRLCQGVPRDHGCPQQQIKRRGKTITNHKSYFWGLVIVLSSFICWGPSAFRLSPLSHLSHTLGPAFGFHMKNLRFPPDQPWAT